MINGTDSIGKRETSELNGIKLLKMDSSPTPLIKQIQNGRELNVPRLMFKFRVLSSFCTSFVIRQKNGYLAIAHCTQSQVKIHFRRTFYQFLFSVFSPIFLMHVIRNYSPVLIYSLICLLFI